ncbi:hypothetical protein PR048_003660 [Dryococelus australis]|uniref:Ubiquitin fusion degradaton protein n=1 Tax=Dryococelus australis TaxID=614101 RepID=A0ABQ9IQ02_9NEOP|nr:hypothetical protein PR048_003660 [Dryococelus australis]
MSFIVLNFGLFCEDYICYSASSPEGGCRNDLEDGGKIIMPPSSLAKLSELDISYPMLFKLNSSFSSRITHSGVLEFVANEGHVYLPKWMMNNLELDEGEPIRVLLVTLPIATFARFQPLTKDFFDISNPKAVLENHLRRHACLTRGDIIAIHYNEKLYQLCVLEIQPGTAVSIIECDMTVEFAPPLDYEETEPGLKPVHKQEVQYEPTHFIPFQTPGHRLDGKDNKNDWQNNLMVQEPSEDNAVVPNYSYRIGSLHFVRCRRKSSSDVHKYTFEPFSGIGQSLNFQPSDKPAE